MDQAAKADSKAAELTPEQKMKARFPQPVRVGDLVGLPVLDDDDSTIGYVRQVVRSPEGKIYLIVPYSAWFGWVRTEWGKRPVAVPIETVVILARQLDALDMSRDDFDDAPTWQPTKGESIPDNEKTLIALGRR
ncbi:MAG: PRC-barrel domain-containing protein [Pseudolabrys sp.]